MKAHHILLTILIITSSLLAQQKPLPAFRIDGQLTNSPEQQLLLAYRTPDGNTLLDTLQLDSVGRFSLSSSKVQVPCLASIQKNRTQINDFFVAPGYHLTITGDATDFMTLFTSKRITGKGAAVNRYRILLDSIMAARKDYTSWFDLDKDALLNHVING